MLRRVLPLLLTVPLLFACAVPARPVPPAAAAPPAASPAEGAEGNVSAASARAARKPNAPGTPGPSASARSGSSRAGNASGREQGTGRAAPGASSAGSASASTGFRPPTAPPAPPPENLDWTRQVVWLESTDWAGNAHGASRPGSRGLSLPPVAGPEGLAANRAAVPAPASLLIDESWVRRAVTGADSGGLRLPMGEAGFAKGEFRTADNARARLGQTDGITYLYWDDFRKAVVANAPNKAFSQLAFRGGDWQIWCNPGGGANPTLCRMGITYMDRTAAARRVAFTLLYAPGAAGLVLCVGSGVRGTSDGAGAELTIDRAQVFRTGDGNCFPPGDSKRIVEGLVSGDAFTFRYRPASRAAEYQGWLSPYGLEQAMALMGWMHRRLDGPG